MATAGYSGTPLAKKLGLSPALKVLLLHPPDNWDYALQNGLVDIKVCAVSEQWSGLKLVVPVKNR